MKYDEVAISGGLGIGGTTFVVLVILKLANLIQIGWFFIITSVIWAPILVSISIAVLIMLFGVLVLLFNILVGSIKWIAGSKK